MKVCCVFLLESPHRGDSNEYTQHIIINVEKKITKIIPHTIISAAMGFLLGIQEQVRNSRGIRNISVLVT